MSYINTVNRVCPHCGNQACIDYSRGVDFEYHTCQNEFNFVSCNNCGLVFLNPIPSPDMLAKVYPVNYKPFHFNADNRGLIYKIRNFLEGRKAAAYRHILPENARILDVGCGDGRYMNILQKTFPEGKVEGIDFGQEAVQRAIQRGLDVKLGAYESIDLGLERYDLMILNQVVEHFIEPQNTIDKIYRELKAGGVLSIETPSLEGWDALWFKERFWGGFHFPRHMVLFNSKTITAFLKKRGFEVVKVRYLLSPVFWVFSFHHICEEKKIPGASFWSDSNPLALCIATGIDLIQLLVRNKTSNMQIIAIKK